MKVSLENGSQNGSLAFGSFSPPGRTDRLRTCSPSSSDSLPKGIKAMQMVIGFLNFLSLVTA